jgi:hypothetical protein
MSIFLSAEKGICMSNRLPIFLIYIRIIVVIALFTADKQTETLAEQILEPPAEKESNMLEKIVKSDEDWRKILTPEQIQNYSQKRN